ncbi:hypothetical protein M2387_000013 [Klebsiella sp. BIGb0407]|nr:hypothetical protein [Klebsiella sp. BIGb0407]
MTSRCPYESRNVIDYFLLSIEIGNCKSNFVRKCYVRHTFSFGTQFELVLVEDLQLNAKMMINASDVVRAYLAGNFFVNIHSHTQTS